MAFNKSLRLLKYTRMSASLIPTRWISNGRIHVEPKNSIVTERINISGSEFRPNTPLTIRARVDNESEKISFESCTQIHTNQDGTFDLSKSESVGGTYLGVDGMGLLWSMVPIGNSIRRLNMSNAENILQYSFDVYESHLDNTDAVKPVHSTSIQRHFMATTTKRIVLDDGIFGSLFIPKSDVKLPAIILIFGGKKRGKVMEDHAAMLSNFGFVTLALSFYGDKGLPKTYMDSDINIKYFEEAVRFVNNLEAVKNDAIGVFGLSIGGTIGLHMASVLPSIKTVVSLNCNLSCPTGIINGDKYLTPTLYKHWINHNMGDHCVEYTIPIPENSPNAITDTGNLDADLLFLVGLDDPSETKGHADLAEKQMKATGKTNYKIIEYPYMGHVVDCPYLPCAQLYNHPLLQRDQFLVNYRGNKHHLYCKTQNTIWDEVVLHLKKCLE